MGVKEQVLGMDLTALCRSHDGHVSHGCEGAGAGNASYSTMPQSWWTFEPWGVKEQVLGMDLTAQCRSPGGHVSHGCEGAGAANGSYSTVPQS